MTIGRIDIVTAVMTMSSFCSCPCVGHLDRVKRIYGYLSKMCHTTICVCTRQSDFSDLPDQDFDWASSVYGNVKETIPLDAPEPLGKPVIMTTYIDANFFHDMITGRLVSGIVRLVNQTPFEWYSK